MNAQYEILHPAQNTSTSLALVQTHPGWTSLTPLLTGIVGVVIGLLLGNYLGWL